MRALYIIYFCFYEENITSGAFKNQKVLPLLSGWKATNGINIYLCSFVALFPKSCLQPDDSTARAETRDTSQSPFFFFLSFATTVLLMLRLLLS